MGSIELSDGTTSRRIQVRGLPGTVRIETGGDAPEIVVPEWMTVTRVSEIESE